MKPQNPNSTTPFRLKPINPNPYMIRVWGDGQFLLFPEDDIARALSLTQPASEVAKLFCDDRDEGLVHQQGVYDSHGDLHDTQCLTMQALFTLLADAEGLRVNVFPEAPPDFLPALNAVFEQHPVEQDDYEDCPRCVDIRSILAWLLKVMAETPQLLNLDVLEGLREPVKAS